MVWNRFSPPPRRFWGQNSGGQTWQQAPPPLSPLVGPVSISSCCCFVFCCFKSGSHYVSQATLHLRLSSNTLFLPPEHWDYRCEPHTWLSYPAFDEESSRSWLSFPLWFYQTRNTGAWEMGRVSPGAKFIVSESILQENL